MALRVRRTIACISLLAASVATTSGPARAEDAGAKVLPVAVLGIDSDDAEEQADALTAAIRARVRAAPGWSLGDATQPLGMLTAALKCPPRPDAGCEQRIAEQIKHDQFIWGVMKKGPGGKVSAELHFYAKGKPVVASTTYSDNLKDQNDDALRREAQTLVTKLQSTTVGAITVHSNMADGDVTIDGTRKEPLKGGQLHVDIAAGPHTVEVSTSGFPPQKTTLTVLGAREALFEPQFGAPEKVEQPKPFPTRTVIGYGAIVAGVGAGIASGVFAANWASVNSKENDLLAKIPNGDACTLQQQLAGTPQAQAAIDACAYHTNHNSEAQTNSALAWVFGGVAVAGIGAGLYIIMTTPKEAEPAPVAPAANAETTKKSAFLSNVQVMPAVGPGGGAMSLKASF
jgi:hypothetical protein